MAYAAFSAEWGLKGNVGALSGYVTAARELVQSARKVDTEFPRGIR
ncbi:MAG: hypothetical protein ACK45F_04040 [bacterium]